MSDPDSQHRDSTISVETFAFALFSFNRIEEFLIYIINFKKFAVVDV